jgi:hypothetical protein
LTKFELVEDRLDEVIHDYGHIPVKDLEEKYKASYSTIRRVLKKHGIIKEIPDRTKYNYIRDHEDEFIQDWIDGILTKKELEEKYKCPYSIIKLRSVELHIHRKKRVDQVNQNDIINAWLSRTMNNYEICEKFRITPLMLYEILKKNNAPLEEYKYGRKYLFNEHYFDIIDNEHKAYWLGFIYADGCHNLKKHSLSITLQERDCELLWQFYKDIECYKVVRKRYNKTYNKYYAYIYIQHEYLSAMLLDKGVPQNKSFVINFPDDSIVPFNLKRHFIRGYFDGDGSVSIPKDMHKMSWNILGNYNFIFEMKKYIELEIKDYSITIHKHSKNNNIYVISKGGRFVTQEFLDWLYKDATIYLQRKYDKYLEIKKYNEEKENEQNREIETNNKSA